MTDMNTIIWRIRTLMSGRRLWLVVCLLVVGLAIPLYSMSTKVLGAYAAARDRRKYDAIVQLAAAVQTYAHSNGGVYPMPGATWQADSLVSHKYLRAVINVPDWKQCNAGYSEKNSGGICYTTATNDAFLWSIVESARYAKLANCTGQTSVAVFAWIASKNTVGELCFPSDDYVPQPAPKVAADHTSIQGTETFSGYALKPVTPSMVGDNSSTTSADQSQAGQSDSGGSGSGSGDNSGGGGGSGSGGSPPPPPSSSPPPAADIAVNFTLKQNKSYPISPKVFGINGFAKVSGNAAITGSLSAAKLTAIRVGIDLAATFPSSSSLTNPSQQNWSAFDSLMASARSGGFHPLVLISYAPSWLEPSPNPCSAIGAPATNVMPTNVTQWGQVAAQVVAHVDHTYPTLQPDYEVWNEPDGKTFMCVSSSDPNPDQTRLNDWIQIYGAAAPLMKSQAARDGVAIRVGGPALAVPKARASLWFPAIVSNASVYPYLDFVSYHQYQFGSTGDSWSSLLATTQDKTIGAAAIFEYVSSVLRDGKQPHASQTPILITEYNTNTGTPDCCRNSRTFAPLWHALVVADLFNSVHDSQSNYGAAQLPIGGLNYFTAIQTVAGGNQFCMFGTWDAAMDCQAGNAPYPQYYAYQLIGSPGYLDATDGGYVAASVSNNKAGIVATGFYTAGKTNVLLVNTTASDVPHVTVASLNVPSYQKAAQYLLNQANEPITATIPQAARYGNDYYTTVDVPPYSVVAVSLTN